MSRKNIIAANWKMNMTPSETAAFLDPFLKTFPEATSVDIVIAPPFVSLAKASETITSNPAVALSAQNMSHEASGAFTGETSAAMLKEVGCDYVILGHSERRSLYGEDDMVINKKVHATLAAGLKPILCIGESLEERDGGQLEFVLSQQLEGSLAGISAGQMAEIVIAYEPVWAIGTGRTASPEQAQETQAFVRSVLATLFGSDVAGATRIQYGGSVKPGNAAELIGQPDIDGFLVGGASLDPTSFAEIVKASL
ncbi:MAG: triose-phosphate isomerase [Verrucomicrobiales bacterium]|jgi:triosephosphate isomerase (TIM)|nr:triose-phosphate isomerase [Verrucomicrobiales bacterium]MDP4790858.1 triose-phosphate isomerase [Verrucomicrobiales bacterium]MDP4939683.1 triose-phosphate isomerase [Verrucomicrobiales bacterium]MDP5006203.1 triose-phosphate isomerase [Verrucomicrobiales bacterium]